MNNQRKKFIINPKFQYSFLTHTLTILLAMGVVAFVVMLKFFADFHQLAESIGLAPTHPVFQFLKSQKQVISSYLGYAVLFLGVIYGIWGVLLSNKIAGPMYRLRKQLKEIKATGKFQEITFREGDYFTEILPELNSAFERVQSPKEEVEDGEKTA